jgi:hypothetical protein
VLETKTDKQRRATTSGSGKIAGTLQMTNVIGLSEEGTGDDSALFLASVYRVFILDLVAIVALSASDIRIDIDHGLGVLCHYLLERGKAEMLSTFHQGGMGEEVLKA